MLYKILLLLAPVALALPTASTSSLSVSSLNSATSCDVSSVSPPLISGLSLPAGQKTTLITVGRGVQNYTCTNGVYITAGALANLYDVGCLYRSFDAATLDTILPEIAYNYLKYPDTLGLPVKVNHLFVQTPNTATPSISPEFATSVDRVILNKTASVNSPTNATANVPWLQLTAIPAQGALSKTVYRLGTDGGQPPSSCSTEGSQLSVQYAASYFFTA